MSENQFPSISAETPVDHTELINVAGAYSLVVNEAQEQFRAFVGDHDDFMVDLQTCQLKVGPYSLDCQLLGSHSYETDTFLWAWGNEGYNRPEMQMSQRAVKWLRDESELGQDHWQFRTRIFPLGEEMARGGVAGWPILYICAAALNARACYNFDYGAGRAFLTIHDEEIPEAVPDAITFPRLLANSSAASEVPVWAIIKAYAQWHELPLEEDGDRYTLDFPDGSKTTVTLDEQERLTNIESQISGRG